MRIKVTLLAFVLLAGATSPALALLCGTFLDPMSVSATALSFGNYTAASASSASTTVTVSCGLLGLDLLPSFTVALSPGNAATAASRIMTKSASQLNYNIYTSSGLGTVWGDGSGGSLTQSFDAVLSLGRIDFTGYGRIPAGQFVGAGLYSDTITVTITY